MQMDARKVDSGPQDLNLIWQMWCVIAVWSLKLCVTITDVQSFTHRQTYKLKDMFTMPNISRINILIHRLTDRIPSMLNHIWLSSYYFQHSILHICYRILLSIALCQTDSLLCEITSLLPSHHHNRHSNSGGTGMETYTQIQHTYIENNLLWGVVRKLWKLRFAKLQSRLI